MALRSARPYIVSILLSALILAFFPSHVEAGNGVTIPPLHEFIRTVRNGEVDSLRGVYVPQVLASPIVSQPEDDPSFVSGQENTLTLFGQAARVGSTGLLAHNYLAGRYFTKVGEQQVFYLVYGDGHTEAFVVTQILRFRALEPDNIWSRFIDLSHGEIISASDLFSEVYAQPGRVVLQTCIRAGGESSWGRLFILAEPMVVKSIATDLPLDGKR